jgi:hypothetical protein
MVAVAFVAPYLMEATTRFVLAAAGLPDVRLGLITTEPAENLGPELRAALEGHWRVDDAVDPRQIEIGVRGLGDQLGHVERLVGALEQLQVPLAQVRSGLGIAGMSVEAAHNVRDKSRMKTVLREAGVPCARHQLVRRTEEAIGFLSEIGLPLVAKPPSGAGAQATYRLDTEEAFAGWLRAAQADPGEVWLLEEFLTGREHSFDSATIDGNTSWSSISNYEPNPLEVLRTPWIQWRVVLPRELDGPAYDAIREVGPAALRALGVETAFSHLEWFERPDGSVAVSEVGARPPGAQISAMIGYAHDVDFFSAWAELVINDRFPAPERNHAAGTVYLRGQGRGRVRAVQGVDRLRADLGDLLVEARWPYPGQPSASSYEGEGFVTVRHPDTATVRSALDHVVSTVSIELVEHQ